jgi:RimJ/RimL family protein N-acetyltransferase
VALTLRAVTDADIPTLFAFQADPVASAMAAFRSRDRVAFETHHRRVTADPANHLSVVEVDGLVVGSVMSWQAENEREVGYWIGRAFWGKGYATAALRAFLGEVDETRPLFGYVAAHNVASQRVLRKAGFTEIRRQQADDVEEVVFRLDSAARPD